MKMISVEDQLPEIGQAVLVYRPDAPETHDQKWKLTYYGLGGRTGIHGFNCYVQPTHWCALPEEPGVVK